METERKETKADDVIRRFGAKRMLQVLDALEKGGYVTLTESGVGFRTRASVMLDEPFGAHLGVDAQVVAERLRNWRRDAARRRNISAFLVMTNKILFDLASARPMNLEKLRAFGVSAKVVESDGALILAALGSEVRSENSSGTASGAGDGETMPGTPTGEGL